MLRQIIALSIKDLKIIFKDTGGVAALFLMPAMFIIVMSNALAGSFGGSDQLINVLVVNLDRGTTGAALVADLKASGGINVETTWDSQPLTRAQAEQLIVDQKRNLAIVIPEDFSDTLQKVAFNKAAQSAQIELVADPATSQQVLGPVKGALAGLSQQAAFMGLMPQGIDLMLNAIDQNGGSVPAAMKTALKDNSSFTTTGNGQSLVIIKETQPANMKIEQVPNTVQQNVPGWALFGVFFISGILAQSILEEKRTGAFRRLVAAPMSRSTVLLGKLVPHVIVNLIQITILFLVGYFVLPLTGLPRLEWGAHPEGLIIISVCASLTANALGLMLAAIAKSEQQVSGLSTLLVLTLAAIGGVMVPRFAMPEFMQTLGVISPHAWALNAYQDILMRGYGIAEILPECAVLLAMAVVMFGVTVRKFKWD
jgi:ABC-2 type transport system permease protein